jgi:hypothetical protein
MVGMVASLCVMLSCLPLALLGGCSSGSQAPKCIPGASAACACPASQQGAQICNSAGTFGACQCSANTPDAAWGAEAALVTAPDTQTAVDALASAGPEVPPDTRSPGTPDAVVPDALSAAPDLMPATGPEVAPLSPYQLLPTCSSLNGSIATMAISLWICPNNWAADDGDGRAVRCMVGCSGSVSGYVGYWPAVVPSGGCRGWASDDYGTDAFPVFCMTSYSDCAATCTVPTASQ